MQNALLEHSAILWPALSNNQSRRPMFGFHFSGGLRQVLLYVHFMFSWAKHRVHYDTVKNFTTYSKTPSKIDKTKVLKDSLMKVESIAECSLGAFCNTFWPALSDNWSWKPILGLLFEWPLKTGFTICSFHVQVSKTQGSLWQSLNFTTVSADLFLFLLLYIPCQQLWSLRDGQFS